MENKTVLNYRIDYERVQIEVLPKTDGKLEVTMGRSNKVPITVYKLMHDLVTMLNGGGTQSNLLNYARRYRDVHEKELILVEKVIADLFSIKDSLPERS